MGVRTVFNNSAHEYDATRKQLIPCFDDFYGTALGLIATHPHPPGRILDLGAGTGLFSHLVSRIYPKAEYTLYDISDKMLDQAKKRFSNSDITVNYVVKDYAKEPIKGTYDLIISALSIHHLSGTEKEILFHNLYNLLNDNGLFINADQVLGETPFIEQSYRSAWIKQVRQKGIGEADLDHALKRMKEDRMSTLSDQLNWLIKAHFSEVNCWYQNYSFVVYSGWKQSRI